MKQNCIPHKKLSSFLDGAVREPERAAIEAHLEQCAECRRKAEEFRAVSDLLGGLEGFEHGPYFALEVKKRLAARLEKPMARWLRVVLVPAGAAVGLLAFVLGSYLGKMISEKRSVQSARPAVETGYILKIDSVKDFPEGSVGDVFSDLVYQGGK